jgi:hypothetical protein
VLALLIFVGGGASWYQQLQAQTAQDELRTSRLLSCLDAAQLTVDPTTAITACRKKYADRVPALLRNNPYAFVPHRATASARPLEAMGAAHEPTWRPTLSPSSDADADAATEPGAGPSQDVSDQPSAGGNKAAAQAAHPPVAKGKTEKTPGAKNTHAADPPKVGRREHVKGKPAAKLPHPAPPAADPKGNPPPRNAQ